VPALIYHLTWLVEGDSGGVWEAGEERVWKWDSQGEEKHEK